MILKQDLEVLVPKYILTISFVFHFLEQIQRPNWGTIVFSSWAKSKSSSAAAPDSLNAVAQHFKGDFEGHRFFAQNASNNKLIRFSEKKVWELGTFK